MRISGTTDLYGIFGSPVKHTFSPGMHNRAFERLGIDACYVPFPVAPEHLGDAIRAISVLGLKGLNITVPHKENVIPFLDGVSEEAGLIGAVNTIEIRDGRMIGHNTDGRGFLRSLKVDARFHPRGRRFFIAGSGGAARAVGFSLALAGAERIRFFDLDARKAEALARDISARTGGSAEHISASSVAEAARDAHCVVNATPLGLRPSDPLSVPGEALSKHHLVCDLVYNPPVTPLLRAARAAGARRLGGIGMLLYQGVIAFEIWTGKKAPVDVMKRALAAQLKIRRQG